VEGSGEEVILLDEDREAVTRGENLNAVAGFRDARGADVNHLQWAAWQFGLGGVDGAVDLAAVSVALNGCVENTEAGLGRMRDFRGEQDAAGAGAKGGFAADEILKSGKKAATLEEFEKGGGFAAGDDEPVDAGQLFGLADEDRFRSDIAQGGGVGVVVALDGEDADAGSGVLIPRSRLLILTRQISPDVSYSFFCVRLLREERALDWVVRRSWSLAAG